jgi:pimeloyl-ACP methyl ester carboxylesterase
MSSTMKDIYFEPVVEKPNLIKKIINFTTHWLTVCSPYLSVKLANKLLGNPFSRRKYQMRTQVAPLSVMLPTSAGEVCLHKFLSDKSKTDNHIFLCHGWGDTSTRFTQLINHLLEQGYTVWSLDQVGHGQSQGHYSDLYCFIEGTSKALEYMREQGSAANVIIGHSMGALGVMNLSEQLLTDKKVILISAPSLFFENMKDAVASVGISKLMLTNLLESVSKQRGVNWQNLTPASNVHKMANSLFIHDITDTICPYQHTKNLAQEIEHSFFSTNGAGHTKLLKNAELLEKVSSFAGKAKTQVSVSKVLISE